MGLLRRFIASFRTFNFLLIFFSLSVLNRNTWARVETLLASFVVNYYLFLSLYMVITVPYMSCFYIYVMEYIEQ
jgi:hypothetical protein